LSGLRKASLKNSKGDDKIIWSVSNLERYAVIMAGGAGSRLWPLSRKNKPKQFISVEGGKCMLLQTIDRIRETVPAEKCLIITNKNLFDITKETVGDIIPVSNIILEPAQKNTAACIAYASLLLKEKIGAGLLCFLPADGYVRNHEDYRRAIEQAYRAAETTHGLVVIGITPSYPATGYGYIHIDTDSGIDENVFPVNRFVEKPDSDTAAEFLASGAFLWNSGILVGSIDAVLENTKRFLPDHYEKLSRAVTHADGQGPGLSPEKAYAELQDISFDKGVLEKCSGIHAVKGCFDWDDIGSLDALSKTFPRDESGNSVQGGYLGMDTGDSVIYSDGILVSTIGVENMIVAATKDAVLICPRDRVQDVKSLVELLKTGGYENLT
jgi:Mannose-1-phosphate guanylyltransferase